MKEDLLKNNSVKILICSHKEGTFPKDTMYLPIHCGKAINNVDLGIQGDNTGDNISSKNPNYCELTALYWAWKNLENLDIVGLVHYRRYFDLSPVLVKGRAISNINSYEDIYERILPSNNFQSLLEKYDIILPMRESFPVNLKKDYCNKHIPEDYEILRDVIKRIYPDYLVSFDFVMTKTNKASCYNMFITRKTTFDLYCCWLFNILFEVEKYVDISKYYYQARVFGFMAERLLNVYCYHHSFRILYKPLFFVTSDKSIPYYLYVLNKLRRETLFLLSLKK